MAAALEEGHTVHLVAGAEPSSASPSSASSASPTGVGAGGIGGGSPAGGFGGMGGMMGMGGDPASMQQQMMQNPEAMRAMLNSPMVQQMLDNPEVLRGIIQSNPQLQAIIEQNPEFGHVLNDPAMLRQSLEMARSPSLMREMTRNTDRAMSNIESHPEGFNMLRRMYTNVQEPLMEAATRGGGLGSDSNAIGNRAPAVDPSNPFAELFATPVAPSGGASGTTPNPWAPSQPATSPLAPSGGGGGAGLGAGLGGFGGRGGIGGGFPGMGGMGGMGGMEEMMNNPAMMEQMTQAMQNPMMQQMLQDPAFFDQVISLRPASASSFGPRNAPRAPARLPLPLPLPITITNDPLFLSLYLSISPSLSLTLSLPLATHTRTHTHTHAHAHVLSMGDLLPPSSFHLSNFWSHFRNESARPRPHHMNPALPTASSPARQI